MLVLCFHVLLVDAVHDENIVACELKARCLDESECHELETDDIVALHLEIAGESHVL